MQQHYWKEEGYNIFILVAMDGSAPLEFTTYAKLYAHCKRHGIDAKQV